MMTVCQPWTMKRKNISQSMVHRQLLKQKVLGGSTQRVPTNTTTGNTTASHPVMIGIRTCIPSTKWKK